MVALTLCGPRFQGGPCLCMCLVFWSKVCAPPTGIRLTSIWVVSHQWSTISIIKDSYDVRMDYYLIRLFSEMINRLRYNLCIVQVNNFVAWSVEIQHPNSAVRSSNFYCGTSCVFFVFLSCVVSGGCPDILRTHISGRPVLVYVYSVLVQSLCSPYRHQTHEHLGCKSS